MSTIAALLGGDVKSSLPPELAAIEDKPFVPLDPHHRTWCEKHGVQQGQSCAVCDTFFPDAVEARKIGASPISKDYIPLKDVQKYIEMAVKKAMEERSAFEAWKASAEGQASAQEAATAKAPELRLKAARVALKAARENTDLDAEDEGAKTAAEQALKRAEEEFDAALEAAG